MPEKEGRHAEFVGEPLQAGPFSPVADDDEPQVRPLRRKHAEGPECCLEVLFWSQAAYGPDYGVRRRKTEFAPGVLRVALGSVGYAIGDEDHLVLRDPLELDHAHPVRR